MVTPQRTGRAGGGGGGGGVGAAGAGSGSGSVDGPRGIDRRLAPSPPGEGSRKVTCVRCVPKEYAARGL